MKSSTARPEAGSNRRQSTRSIRSTAQRPENYYARPWGRTSTGNVAVDQASTATIGFFPAITHFTDSIAALPKEVVRHLTVLKETEGKAYAPDNAIKELEKAIANLPPPNRRSSNTASQSYFGFSVINSANVSVSGSVTNGSTTSLPGLTRETTNVSLPIDGVDEQADLPRRQLFHKLRSALHEMTNILDEKNHYISSANEALAKQLARLDSSFPYIKNEVSEEAREGSNRHWALPHMRDARRTNGMPATERTRRDYQAANSLAAAAAAVHEGDIAATRSEARREAMMAKRSRNHHIDSDFDDRPVVKKSHKKRVQEGGDRKGSTIATVNGTQSSQANKRRRIDKYGNGGTVIERSIGAVMNNRTTGASPRETPMAEGTRKKARPPPAPPNRKRVAAKSPSLASSPTRGTFSTTTHRRDYSPVTGDTRPSSAVQNMAYPSGRESSHNRPTSVASETHQSHAAVRAAEQNGITSQPASHPSVAEAENAFVPADEGDTIEGDEALADPNTIVPSDSPLKREAIDSQSASLPEAPASTAMAATRSRGGSKASKPSTPTVTSFGDRESSTTQTLNTSAAEQASRARNTRGAANGSSTSQPVRRSHKKGGGLSAAIIAAATAPSDEDSDHDAARGASEARSALDGDADVDGDVEIDEEDPEEPGGELYCVCNRPSFGAMIACDNEECPREWFHLDCVGLERAPPGKTKWFCPECRELGLGGVATGAGLGHAARGRSSIR